MHLGTKVTRVVGFAERQGRSFHDTCRSCGNFLVDRSHNGTIRRSEFLTSFTSRRRETSNAAIQPSYQSSWPASHFFIRGNEASLSSLQEPMPRAFLSSLAGQHVLLAGSKRIREQTRVSDDRASFPIFTRSISHTRQLQAKAVSSGSEIKTKENKRPARRRRRLDEICVERFPEYSRTLIQSWIMQGKVLVEGQPVLKAGSAIPENSNINIIAEIPKYVCRAGHKLEGALEHFLCDVRGVVALDAGLSTGGFTDCLLQNGAARVYGVDVGYGQVSEKIRTDERVVVMERTNLRYLPPLPEPVDLVTLDLSFISILTVMPAVKAAMKPSASLITLIKPQFEAKRGQVGSGGIVRDPNVHSEVLERVTSCIQGHGFTLQGWIPSPLKGADGNIEFLAYFCRGIEVKEVPPALNEEGVVS